jgi:hypothetical protein
MPAHPAAPAPDPGPAPASRSVRAARRLLAGALGFVVAGGSATLPAACAPAARLRAAPAPGAARAHAGAGAATRALTRHVVVVSVDGLRADAIARYDAPTMQRLIREGRATLDARTILPSKTLPSHTSMLTGVPPDRHGITWNDDRVVGRGLVPVPTIFAVARARGLHTAAFFGKAKFRHLMVPETLDYAQAPRGWWGRWSARRTVRDVRAYLEGTAASGTPPHLLFVHLGEPDYAGHAVGWMSWFLRPRGAHRRRCRRRARRRRRRGLRAGRLHAPRDGGPRRAPAHARDRGFARRDDPLDRLGRGGRARAAARAGGADDGHGGDRAVAARGRGPGRMGGPTRDDRVHHGTIRRPVGALGAAGVRRRGTGRRRGAASACADVTHPASRTARAGGRAT